MKDFQALKTRAIGSTEEKKTKDFNALKAKAIGTGDIVDSNYLNMFSNRANQFLKSADEAYKGMTYATGLTNADTFSRDFESLNDTAGKIRSYYNLNRENMGEESYKSAIDWLDNLDSVSRKYLKAFDDAKNTMSLYRDENEYNAAVEAAQKTEALRNYDLTAGKAEIDKLTDIQNRIDDSGAVVGRAVNPNKEKASRDSLLAESGYKSYSDLSDALSQKQAEYAQAERLQNAENMYKDAINADDFAYFSNYGQKIGLNNDFDAVPGTQTFSGSVYNKVAYAKDNPEKVKGLQANGVNVSDYRYSLMTDEEVAVYNYYLGKEKHAVVPQGTADAYLESIEDKLNQRQATEIYDNFDQNLASELFGIALTGVSNAMENQTKRFSDGYKAPSATEYAQSELMTEVKSRGGLASFGADLVATTSNMIPSIVTSAVLGGVGGAFGLGMKAAQTLGRIGGGASMYASVFGSSKQAMLNDGYGENQANLYGHINAALEVGLQEAIGGIPGLGGYLTGDKIEAFASSVNNAALRFAIRLGGNAVGEAVEESLQEVLDPMVKAFVTGEHPDDIDWEQVAYAGLLGAVSSITMGIAPSIVNDINAKSVYGDVQRELVDEALASPEGTESNRLGQYYDEKLKQGKKLSGMEIADIVEQNEVQIAKERAAEVKTDAQRAEEMFRQNGLDERSAQELAEAYDIGKEGQTVESFVSGMSQGYTYGLNNYKGYANRTESAVTNTYFNDLTDEQKKIAWNVGSTASIRRTAERDNAIQQELLKAANVKADKGSITMLVPFDTLTSMQKESFKLIAKANQDLTKAKLIFFSSEEITVDGKKRRVLAQDVPGVGKKGDNAPNGFHEAGVIYIDINSGNKGQGLMLTTFGHEAVHYIKLKAPAQYKAMADFLFSELGKAKADVDLLVGQKLARARANGHALTEEGAYEEVVADAFSEVITSSNAVERMYRLKAQNGSLWNAVKEFFGKLFKSIKAYYQKMDADTPEAEIVRGWSDEVRDTMSRLFAEGAVEAGNRSTEAVMKAQMSGEMDMDGNDNVHMASFRSFTEGAGLFFEQSEDGDIRVLDREGGRPVSSVNAGQIENSPLGNMVKIAEINGFISPAEANRQYGFLAELVNLCLTYKDFPMVWEIAGTQVFSAIKSNSDKQYSKTIDFSTVCKKTQQIINVMSQTMVKLDRGLTREEVVDIVYNEVGKSGEPTPCPVCYVFARWMGIGGILQGIADYQTKWDGKGEKAIRNFAGEVEDDVMDFIRKSGKDKYFAKDGKPKLGAAIADIKQKLDSRINSADKAIVANNALIEHIAEVENQLNNSDLSAKEIKKLQKELDKSRAKLQDSDELQKTRDNYEEQKSRYEEYQWLTKTYLDEVTDANGEHLGWKFDPNFKPVPHDILFDLNRGADFAKDYPKSWKYRTTKGCNAGKAILPYSDARVGETVQGVANLDTIKMGELNPFLNGNIKGQNDSIKSAIRSQRVQNLLGGMRYQSTSDYRMEYGSDYLMTFLEMQAIGAKVQLYTKVIEFVPFACTVGADVNMSLMPWGKGYVELEDGTKKLVYSNVTGINAEAAKEMFDKYDNAQPILVGISDEHIRLALKGDDVNGDWVTFVIPYHASGNKTATIQNLMNQVGETVDLNDVTDYSAVQTDVEKKNRTPEQKAMWELRMQIIRGSKRVGDKDKAWDGTLTAAEKALLDKNPYLNGLYNRFFVDENAEEYHVKLSKDQASQIFPYEYWDKSLTYAEADQNGERFKEYCETLGIIPRFSGYNSKGERVDYGDFSNDKGYWKTLIDRKMYNNDGTYHEQRLINVSDFKTEYLDPAWATREFDRLDTDGHRILQPDSNPAKTSAITEKVLARLGNGKHYSDRSEVELGTLFSGADTFALALDGLVHAQFAAENNPKIISVYKMNHGGYVFDDVLNIDPKNMPKVQHLHVSPPCINFSSANNSRGERPIDNELANKIAEIIRVNRPRALTIENVEGYMNSTPMKTIIKAIEDAGYTDHDINTYKDSDFGGYTMRKRVVLRAMRDEKLPAVTGRTTRAKGWGEATTMSYLNSLPLAKTINPRMINSLKEYNGIDVNNISKPLLVFGESYKNKEFGHAYFDETLPTIIAESGASRVFMPDGSVREATPELLAKIMGLDGFKLPTQVTTARRVIGNGIPAAITKNIMGPVINQIKADNESRISRGQSKQYSDREYLELAKNPKANEDRLREMVNKAAEDAGYTERVYHGTMAEKAFNIFKAGMGQYGNGVYATYDERTAKDYGRVMNLYAKIEKMADFPNVYSAIGMDDYDDYDDYAKEHGFRDFWDMVEAGEDDPSNIEYHREVIDMLIDKGFDSFYDEGNDGFVIWDIPGYETRLKSADIVTYDDNGDVIPLSQRFNEKSPDIRYSDRSDFAKGAEDYYGTTSKWELGGYLTVNGKMLDFSAGQGQRVIDHREIADYYFENGFELSNDLNGSGLMNEGMIRFMNDGNIRFQPFSGFEIVQLPTKEQFATMRDIIDDYFDGYLSIDYSDENGKYLGTTDYEEGTSASRIIADIKKHFADGTLPKGTAMYSERVAQAITSDKTSRPQIPALFKDKRVEFGKTNVDIGGGKYDFATNYLKERGTKNYIFDPFNRDSATNRRALSVVMHGGADTATNANVLNVIAEPDARANVILEVAKAIKPGGTAYFMVYEGDRSGIGKTTSDGWQNNLATDAYVPEIKKYFNEVQRNGKLITAKNPKSNLPKAYWELEYGGDVIEYSERDTEFATDSRSLLANALESTTQSDAEYTSVQRYKAVIDKLNAEQEELGNIRSQIREMMFTKGTRDDAWKEKMTSLSTKAKKLASDIDSWDKTLLRLESTKPIKDVLAREREAVKQKAAEAGRNAIASIRDTSERGKYISRIESIAYGLQKRLEHPSAKTAIPEVIGKTVSSFIKNLDFTTFDDRGVARDGKANQKRVELRASVTKLAQELSTRSIENDYGNLDISPDMEIWLTKLTDTLDNFYGGINSTFYVRKMELDDVKNLYKIIKSLETTVNAAGRLYTSMSFNAQELGKMTIDHLAPLKERKRDSRFDGLGKMLAWDYAQPITVFERFGDAGREIMKMLMQGQKQEAENVAVIDDFVRDAYTEEEVNEWREKLHKVRVGGKEYEVTTAYLMELHNLLRDPDARRHILEGGGIRFDELNINNKVTSFDDVFVTEEDIQAMEDALASVPRAKEVAENLEAFMAETGAAWGNKISMIRFGYHAFGNIPNYYPIKTIKKGSEYEAQQKRANIYALLNKSFTKERQINANNAIIVGDIFQTFNNHMAEMALYNAWALPVIDTIKWFNYREGQDIEAKTSEVSVKRSLERAYGKNADEYIRRLLESINSQKSGGLSESVAFKNLRMVNRVAVSANIRVAVQQPFSITRAFELISPKYVKVLSGKARTDAFNEMIEHSSFGRWKSMGYYDVDVSRPMEVNVLKNATFADKLTEKTMVLAEDGDNFTWAVLWNACKNEVMADKSIKAEDVIPETAKRFDNIIVRTQVVDSVLTKSQWMRSDSFWHRMTSSFMSEPMTSYNTLLRQYDKWERDMNISGASEAFRKNGKTIAKTVAIFTLTQLVNALVTAPIDAARDDDDYKTYIAKLAENIKDSTLQNLMPTSMMPYIADIAEYAIYGKTDRPDLQVFTKIIDLASQIKSTIDSYDYFKLHKLIKSSLSMASSLSGIPMSNITRDVVAMWNTVVGGIGDGKLKFQTAKDSSTVGYDLMYEAIVKGNTKRAGKLYAQLKSNLVDDSSIKSGLTKRIKDDYTDGKITYDEATKYLADTYSYLGEEMNPNDIYWKIDEWDYIAENGSNEGYAKYDEFVEAVSSGANLKKVINEYRNHGVSDDTLKNRITDEFKEVYIKASKSERAKLKGYLLNAYEMLGDDRVKRSKLIDKWVE